MKIKVYPEHCNSHSYNDGFMIHGGEILRQADKCAAIEVEEYIYTMQQATLCSTEKLVALTVGVDKCKFSSRPKLGDVLSFKSEILTPVIDHKINCVVKVYNAITIDLIFFGIFSFCTFVFDKEKNNYILSRHGINNAVN